MDNICFVHSQAYSAFMDESVGGTQLQLRNISVKLSEEGFNVKFITRLPTETKNVDGVELIDGIDDAEGLIEKLFASLRLFRKMKQIDANVYFSSNSNMEVGIVGLYCFLFRKKHITRTVHSSQLNKDFISSKDLKQFINQLGLRQADLILVQCKEHKNLLENWLNTTSKVFRNSFNIKEKEYTSGEYILWIGRRVEWKRPDLFLDLAEYLENEKFIMISPKTGNSEKFHSKIEERASKIKNLKLIERVPRDRIQEFYDNAKIFINTSEAEGFPNTFIESGISYTPILSYKINPDNFLESENCGYDANGNYKLLKKYLTRLLNDKILIEHKGKNCRKYVEAYHDIDQNIEHLKRQIDSIN